MEYPELELTQQTPPSLPAFVPIKEEDGFCIGPDNWTSGFSRRGEMLGYPILDLNDSSEE